MNPLHVDRKSLETEIEALQKQAQEAQLTLFKIEGALQFAHYILSKLPQPVELADAPTVSAAPKNSKKK